MEHNFSLSTQTKARDPVFDFRVANNKTTGKIFGICWKDRVVRGHFQGTLLDVVMLDMMKRQKKTVY